MTRRTLATAAALAAAVASALPAAAGSATTGARVTIKGVAFHSPSTKIRKGQRVTWLWRDPYVTHNVHAVGRLRFPGAGDRQTGSYTVRFRKPGVYRYVCTIHPGMKGTITVS